ncbi:MAG: hypothetical protein H6574_10860 [Lewinellaceae bacterium]|nr:hypothetical protein [Saprospiraceae bacterium]MCB9331575.1 hypothetical protein [Lewinellaceae bacterium]
MRRISIILVASFLLVLSGCTILGLIIGGSIDKRKSMTVSGWEIVELPIKQPIAIYTNNQRKITGRYMGVTYNIEHGKDTIISAVKLLRTMEGVEQIPMTDIAHIQTRRSEGKILGTIIGLAIDGAIVVAAVSSMSFTMFNATTSTATSCPLIYSFNGTEYQLDAEPFGGAIFQAAERPDWDNLDHLKATDGVYRLKMANVNNETQHVDFVTLLAVDHPIGSRIFPSFDGKLHTVSHLQAPRTARDLHGFDVKNALQRANGDFWLSNPYGRNLDDPDALRDGIVLEFDRPTDARAAALVLQVQNTPWAAGSMHDLLALPGSALPDWYHALNNSYTARKQLMDFLIQEGMLQVSIWTEDAWQPAGHVWVVGPAIAKDILVELDVPESSANTFKIKLEAPPGVWLVHSAEIDFNYYNVPSFAKALEPQKAVDQNGRNLLPLLQKADNQYYEMAEPTDAAWLEFQAPPKQKGMDRSFILNSGGYYTIHTQNEGVPQMEVLQQMLEKPGTFTRFELEKLYKKTDALLRVTAAVQ